MSRKKFCLAAVALAAALVVGWAAAPRLLAEDAPQSRTISGSVLDANDQPVAEAVVYLKNTKNNATKTFISEKDGSFRFRGLSMWIDYQVYAEKGSQKSDVKSVGSFDTRPNVVVRLRMKN